VNVDTGPGGKIPDLSAPAARTEHHGQVVDIMALLQERISRDIIEAALDGMRKAERAARPGRPRLRLVSGIARDGAL
jgi:hypothetical protein